MPLPIVHHAVAHSCTRCGACCRRPWTVGVDAEEAARYAAIDWGAHEPRLRGRTLFNSAGRTHTIAREPDGACVFLDGANLCVIHRVLGLEQKPKTCRSFPYNFIETPDDVRVSTSWATRGRRPGVAMDAETRAEIEATYARDRRANGVFFVRDRDRVRLVDTFRAFARDGDADASLIAIAAVAHAVDRGELDERDLATVREALARERAAAWPDGPGPREARAPAERETSLDPSPGRELDPPPAGRPAAPRLARSSRVPAFWPLALAAPVRAPRDLLRIVASMVRLARGEVVPPHLGYGVRAEHLRAVSFGSAGGWSSYLDDLLLDGLMTEPRRLARYVDRVIIQYASARWLAKLAAARAGRKTVTDDDQAWACAEAQAFSGPQRGTAGRVARMASERSARRLAARAQDLARLLRADP